MKNIFTKRFTNHLLQLLLIFGLLLNFSGTSFARHKCPSPPNTAGYLLWPIFLPFATVSAASKSSNTSGCTKGHASKGFYTPSAFLEKNMPFVAEDAAKGEGSHLTALNSFTGCPIAKQPLLSNHLKSNYSKLFGTTTNNTNKTKNVIGSLKSYIKSTPELASSCVGQFNL